MATFASIASRTPTHFAEILPSWWAADWTERKDAPLKIGFRSVSQADIDAARAEAAKKAWRLHPEPVDIDNRGDAFNDALIVWLVARGTCDPTDVRQPWIECPEDNVAAALTSEALRVLFDRWCAFRDATGPLGIAIDDDELAELRASLDAGSLGKLGKTQEQEARRLLGAAWEMIRGERDDV